MKLLLSLLLTFGYLPSLASSGSVDLGSNVSGGGGGGGSGTVTSVALTVPSFLSVSGSPVTTSGTLAVSLAVEAVHAVLIGPSSGSSAAPTFRALVPNDLALSGTHGQVLSTNGAGVLSLTTVSGGGGTPAGSTGDVQFNTSGAFDADTGKFVWDKTNHRLGLNTST